MEVNVTSNLILNYNQIISMIINFINYYINYINYNQIFRKQ